MQNAEGWKPQAELLDTGAKSYSDLCAQIGAVVDRSSDDLGIMRIDLCADLPGVPVSWFHQRVSVKYKRISRQIGPITWEVISKAGIETISAGARPNLIRIYNKVAGCTMQFRKMQRRVSKDADALDFEKEFGFTSDSVLTRVERQFGGGRIPDELQTFGGLSRAADYNPFDVLKITGGKGERLPTVQECQSVTDYLAGVELHRRIKGEGLQTFTRWANAQSGGNGTRLLKRLGAFIPGSNLDSITVERIFETYRASLMQQLRS